MKKIAIIGAGLSGLATAWFIKNFDTNLDVTVFESDKKGGMINSERNGDINLETGPAFFILENPLLHKIAAAIPGIKLNRVKDDKVHVIKDTFYQKAPGGFMEIDNGMYSFLSGGFMAMFGLKKKVSVWENLSFFDFLKSTYGQTYAETFGSTFSRAVFFCEAEDLMLQAAFPELYKTLKTGLNLKESVIATGKQNSELWKNELNDNDTAQFAPGIYSPENGMADFIEHIFNDLKTRGVHFEFSKIAEITGHKEEYSLHSKHSKFGPFSNLIVTSGAAESSLMIKPLHKDLSAALSELKYRSATFVYSAYPMKTFNRSGFGFFAPRKEKLTISGANFVNAYNLDPEKNGMFLTRTLIAGDLSLFSNEEMIEIQTNDYEKIFGLTAKPEWSKVYRHEKAAPSLDKNYVQWKEKINTMAREFTGIQFSGKDFNSGNLNTVLKDAFMTAKSLC